MGCDVHYLVEGRRKDTGKWEWATWDKEERAGWEGDYQYYSIFDEFFSQRNYSLFYLLAGVRYWNAAYGEEPVPLFAGRGVPEDIGEKTKDEGTVYRGDHSFTWIGKVDFDLMTNREKSLVAKVDPAFYSGLVTLLSYHNSLYTPINHPGYSELRLLIGFDS